MNLRTFSRALHSQMETFFQEDDLTRNVYYNLQLPNDFVKCQLKFKSDLIVSGLPYFFSAFEFLGYPVLDKANLELEGQFLKQEDKVFLEFELPFSVALTGERIALNLLQRCSSISTFTNKFVHLAKPKGIAILDTRKTTPGLRSLEKYAVRMGGGFNHRLGQADLWMVKDNHKMFFGGIGPAVNYFRNMNGFYTPILVEIHSLSEMEEAIKHQVQFVMLDNFGPQDIRLAVELKPKGMKIEVSGGINLQNLENYLIDGVDAISVGSMTYGAPPVDISLKYEKC